MYVLGIRVQANKEFLGQKHLTNYSMFSRCRIPTLSTLLYFVSARKINAKNSVCASPFSESDDGKQLF